MEVVGWGQGGVNRNVVMFNMSSFKDLPNHEQHPELEHENNVYVIFLIV